MLSVFGFTVISNREHASTAYAISELRESNRRHVNAINKIADYAIRADAPEQLADWYSEHESRVRMLNEDFESLKVHAGIVDLLTINTDIMTLYRNLLDHYWPPELGSEVVEIMLVRS